MMCTRVIVRNVQNIKNRRELLTRCVAPQIFNYANSSKSMLFSTKQNKESNDDDTDQPIKFSTTKAATSRVIDTRRPQSPAVLWYEGLVVSMSLAVFLIYFCILREENDIDLQLNMPIANLTPPQNPVIQNVQK